MLSNLVITSQRFVVIIDQAGLEKLSHRLLCQLLREQGQDEQLTVKTLLLNPALKNPATFTDFVTKCSNVENKCNVLLPPLADLLCYQSARKTIEFIHKLRLCDTVQRLFLWVTPANLIHPSSKYLISAFEYMADLLLHLETSETLSIVTRKPGGSVTNKRYTYTRTKKEFLVETIQNSPKISPATAPQPITNTVGATFKIELNEDEMIARNTLKMPYEKTSETNEGSIIYTPDAADDFDDEEEDPDDDLCI